VKNKKGSIVLYLAPFLIDTAMGSVMIAVPLLAISLGLSSITLGTLGFTPGLAYISLCFLFGKLSERWQRKNLVVLGSFIYIVSSSILCFSSRIYQLYLSMLLIGIGAAMFWPTLETWIAEKESKRPLVQRMGLFNTSWSAGLTIGPLIGGILFGIDLKLPFYFALTISTFIFFVLFWGTQEVNLSNQSKTLAHKILLSEDPPGSFSLYIQISRIANFTLWLSLGVIRYIFPKLGTELGISPSFLGLLMFTFSLSQTLTFYVLGITHKWHYRIFPLAFFQLIAVVGFAVVFMTSSSLLFFLAFVLIGMSIGMTHSSSLFYSINVTSQRGPSAAIHETVLGTGGLFGPLMGGLIAQEFSLRAPYLLTAVIIAIGILIQMVLIKGFKGSDLDI